MLHKWYSCCTNPSHNNFLTFSDRGLELTQMIFLSFWGKLENGEIMISAFIANENALHQLVELLGHVCLNLTLFLTCCFLQCVKKLNFWGMSIWTSLCFLHVIEGRTSHFLHVFNKLRTSLLFQFELYLFIFLSKELYSTFIQKKSNMEIQGEPLSQELLNFPG